MSTRAGSNRGRGTNRRAGSNRGRGTSREETSRAKRKAPEDDASIDAGVATKKLKASSNAVSTSISDDVREPWNLQVSTGESTDPEEVPPSLLELENTIGSSYQTITDITNTLNNKSRSLISEASKIKASEGNITSLLRQIKAISASMETIATQAAGKNHEHETVSDGTIKSLIAETYQVDPSSFILELSTETHGADIKIKNQDTDPTLPPTIGSVGYIENKRITGTKDTRVNHPIQEAISQLSQRAEKHKKPLNFPLIAVIKVSPRGKDKILNSKAVQGLKEENIRKILDSTRRIVDENSMAGILNAISITIDAKKNLKDIYATSRTQSTSRNELPINYPINLIFKFTDDKDSPTYIKVNYDSSRKIGERVQSGWEKFKIPAITSTVTDPIDVDTFPGDSAAPDVASTSTTTTMKKFKTAFDSDSENLGVGDDEAQMSDDESNNAPNPHRQ
ncbi:MAG: hypothetical protein GKR77_06715 [Legionellales bacterium]|nr:hypothetical protein [Legionellales bacterium]